MKQFVDKCKTSDIFNVMNIREVAKRTNAIGDINPQINSNALSSRDLFNGRLSQEELSGGHYDEIEEDLTDLPSVFSDAVLYKVVQTIDS